MGSVVLDAVNSFFGPLHLCEGSPTLSTDPPPRRNQTPPRSDTPMPASERRASSSSTAKTTYQPQQQQVTAPMTATTTKSSSTSSHHARRASAHPPLSKTSIHSRSTQLVEEAIPLLDPSASSTPAMNTPTVGPQTSRPAKIKVRDLEHIQSFANEDMSAFSEIGSRSRSKSQGAGDENPQYEISDMKVEHIIEMVAGLLTKITTTNDQQHEHLHRQPAHLQNTSQLNPQTNSVLAFHGKNVPSITILSYLSRINKYCPTSYEVFLSLLVYFDRMTEKVNAGPMQSLRQATEAAVERSESNSSSSESLASDRMEGITATTPQGTQTATPPSSGNMQKGPEQGRPGTPHSRSYQTDSPPIPAQPASIDQYNLSHFFVVDSFNIHRLVIAGVTCASKFFSDIFYTNSRYAKVGGLPLPELNHLELQFLLLNDFRLSIPVEEIEAYGTMLVEFYAREVVAQRKAAAAEAQAMQMRSLSESSSDSVATVQAV